MNFPTIGRKVYFKPDPVNQPDLIYDATVAGTSEDLGIVNLGIRDTDGNSFARQSVVFVQPGETPPAHPYAHWMPYQVAAASAPIPVSPIVLTDADAAADLAGTPRPDNSTESFHGDEQLVRAEKTAFGTADSALFGF